MTSLPIYPKLQPKMFWRPAVKLQWNFALVVRKTKFGFFKGKFPMSYPVYFKAPSGGGNADIAGLTDKLYEYFDGTKDDNFRESLLLVDGKQWVIPIKDALINLR